LTFIDDIVALSVMLQMSLHQIVFLLAEMPTGHTPILRLLRGRFWGFSPLDVTCCTDESTVPCQM